MADKKFSIVAALEAVKTAHAALSEVIKAQNPGFDDDNFFIELQTLVDRCGRGEPSPTMTTAELTAFAQPLDLSSHEQPDYNLAGDILVKAYLEWQQRNRKDALTAMVSFFEAEDANQLIRSIATLNSIANGPEMTLIESEDKPGQVLADDAEDFDETFPDDIAGSMSAESGNEDDFRVGNPEDNWNAWANISDAKIIEKVVAEISDPGDALEVADTVTLEGQPVDLEGEPTETPTVITEEQVEKLNKVDPKVMAELNRLSMFGSDEEKAEAQMRLDQLLKAA